MKKIIVTILVVFLCFGLFACAPAEENDETIILKVNLGSATPAADLKPSAANPYPKTAAYFIAEAFMEQNEGIEIVFDRAVPTSSQGAWTSYMSNLLDAGKAPDIVFAWNDQMLYRDWFIDLTDAFQQPNPYVPSNEHWSDLIEPSLFSQVTDARGQIKGVPILAFPGTATALFFNLDLFERYEIDLPKTYQELKICVEKFRDKGVTVPFGTQPESNFQNMSDNWDMQFTVGPSYGMNMEQELDYNSDGIFTNDEVVRALYEGKFDANSELGQKVWTQIRSKFTEVLPSSYANTDYNTLWNNGQLPIFENGLWHLQVTLDNPSINFDWTLMPSIVVSHDDTTYMGETVPGDPLAYDIQYTEEGFFELPLREAYHIVDPAKNGNKSEKVAEAAIKFLQFLCTTDAQNEILAEFKGSAVGAVKGTTLPVELSDWVKNPFPKLSTFRWRAPVSLEQKDIIKANMEGWVKTVPDITNEDFFNIVNKANADDAQLCIERMSLSTEGWRKA